MARSSDRAPGATGTPDAVDSTEVTDGSDAVGDPLRPSDHYDSVAPAEPAVGDAAASAGGDRDGGVTNPRLGLVGYLRFFWRQLTSMKTALFLLMLLAVAAIPGSLVPQRTSDPNGVVQYRADHPDLFPVLDKLGVFDTYSSPWFSAVYLLLFISLIGCIIPRTKHHFEALRARPPRTPARLSRLAGYRSVTLEAGEGGASGVDLDPAAAVTAARAQLKRAGYRTEVFGDSVSAERGYLRETGNLVFHSALVGVLLTVGVGGGFGYTGQRVIVEGQTFTNALVSYDSFNPGRWFSDSQLSPYNITLDKFRTTYEETNTDALGQPTDYTADVTTRTQGGDPRSTQIKVNSPLAIGGSTVYLLGNGYAVDVTVTAPDGSEPFTDTIPFLPQDANLTSQGVVKVPDGLSEQVGMIGFFYPSAVETGDGSGILASSYPDLLNPVLSLNVYDGDLALDDGVPQSVYSLKTDDMTEIAGAGAENGQKALQLSPGETVDLPNGLGTITFNDVKRFASLDVHHDPSQVWVLLFAVLTFGGLLTALFVPRRRVWVKATATGTGLRLEYAGLARGEDPTLDRAVGEVARTHLTTLGVPAEAAKAASRPGSTSNDTGPSASRGGRRITP
ncbi:cytochrome c biogenesis protein ResB [Frigoribacterium sp. CFBP 13707]|uniref:cytochrome c biogenesis protein ResB n=1 Tax=Frigoribacterium sp. CFBP 13707 TaxID=2775313 RepID=UPI0017804D10|nr:cytochrome c biogenesis protein ResB [Frigoribacterium sp. CFBP 13707]MBD8727127.1 cytochrome c biogenesis protein ResB [Frigoribacterium sp. CFBP 13707]